MIRWVSGLLIAALLVLLLLSLPQKAVQLVVVALSMLALWEYFQLTLKEGSGFVLWSGIVLCGLSVSFLILGPSDRELVVGVLAALLVMSFLLHFSGPDLFEDRLKRLSLFLLGLMYVVLLFVFWGWIVALPRNLFWTFLLLAATFLSDTGAYLVGRAFGRHKLAPKISPGKTIEGLLGGWASAVGAGFAVRALFWSDFPVSHLLLVTSLIALVGPLGDLSESLIKRGVREKDSGNVIPGHGGLLDRVDALLFTGPVVFYFAKYFS